MEQTLPETTAAPEVSKAEETPERGAPTTTAEPEVREGPASRNTAVRPAVGTNGMVSSAHPLATRAGLEIMDDGGNAFDAAVAVAASLGVVEPMMSGVGGYGAIVVYSAEERWTRFLEVGSRTPASLDPSVFRPPTPGYAENRCGARAVATPGNLNAWETMWEEYGEAKWPRLFRPAIGYADRGFPLDQETAAWLGSEYAAFPAHAQEIYGPAGIPLAAGESLVQEDLAESLRLISEEGSEAVYGGRLGAAMAAAAQDGGGFLSEEDLRRNRAEWRETIGLEYRDHRVVTAAPPSTAWAALVRLGVMGRYDAVPAGHNTTAYVHAATEISKRVSTTTRRFAADPEKAQTPLGRLLSDEYLESEAARVDPNAVAPYDPPALFDTAATCSPTGYRPTGYPETQQHTTHFVVADRDGNVVSATQTLGNVFGSKVMPEGTGIWLNDALAWSRFEPVGNVFDVYPGRQPLYALCPTIIMRDGRPRIALGTPGGRTIQQTTPQMITNMLDFDMDVQQALSAPRFSHVVPDLLVVEQGIPQYVGADLSALGHDLIPAEYPLGNAHALTIEYGPGGETTRFTGAADPRGGGSAAGY
ncbi:MAG TPA: gamma-glutamyltransferase [Rubrobacter sp.]|nr:gamma-glutamyltransferase [Rubrobacter sp.]